MRVMRVLSIVSFLSLFSFLVLLSSPCYATGSEEYPLEKANIDLTDQASLQRGAKIFMNYCLGCHSLKYVRFNDMAQYIGIVDAEGKVLEQAVKDNLLFGTDKITDPVLSGMTKTNGAAWFGTAPPDLSLVTRSRGVDWVYTYLKTFYEDTKKPWGVNNMVFPDVAMPHVLASLQGLQTREDNSLKLKTPGSLTPEQYDATIRDLVNFLALMSEPHQLKREKIGVFVLLFLCAFFVFAWVLKREYWKDIH